LKCSIHDETGLKGTFRDGCGTVRLGTTWKAVDLESVPLLLPASLQTAGTHDRRTQARHFIAATILSARKLIDCIELDKPNFAKDYWVEKAINEAVFVLEKIDKKWATVEAASASKTYRPSDSG
jgi:hypothetical protein